MSLFNSLIKFTRQLCLLLIVISTLLLNQSVLAQTVILRVDGDIVSAGGDGSGWGVDAIKYLQDALVEAAEFASEETPYELWVAATVPGNPYVPDRSAATPFGTGNRESTFLLDTNNIRVLGGFLPGMNDPLDRDPLNNVTVLSGEIPITSCGHPSAGDCNVDNGTPACDSAACCNIVCEIDPTCCNVVWDQDCADLAVANCGCGDPASGDCFIDNGSPACDDADCCTMVCAAKPECCEITWDALCANLAILVCNTCGGPGTGDCFTETPGIAGCSDIECCAIVCNFDPFCCETEWDDICADINHAAGLCKPHPVRVYHVVTATDIDNTVQIDGFTITKGLADDSSSPNDRGGGMLIVNASLVVIRINFTENDAPGHGGGAMNMSGNSQPFVVNSFFIENTGDEGGAIHYTDGGSSGGTFVNCLFSENHATLEGGAINPGSGGLLTFINCTLAFNSVDTALRGGAIYLEGVGPVELINCILWGNVAGMNLNQIDGPPGMLTVSYSDIQGTPVWPGDYNINQNPDFVNAAMGGYRLIQGSPCIDTGDPDDTVIPPDKYDVDQDGITDDPNDPEFYEPTPDLELFDRIVDGDLLLAAEVDMGAYEFQTCIWDLSNNCVVDTTDLLFLFGNWGPCADCNDCPADFDGDCTVSTIDLLAIFANWGSCYCDVSGIDPLTVEEELADACLTMDDWDEYVAVMTGQANQATKDRYKCWMEHYINDCNRCTCLGPTGCPAPDPFDD